MTLSESDETMAKRSDQTSSLSSASACSNVYEDADLTPKPLRISKRGRGKCHGTPSVNTSPTLTTSQTQRSQVPTRRSSVLTKQPPPDLSQRDPEVSTSKWIQNNAFLNVQKQRQSVPTHPTKTADTPGPKHLSNPTLPRSPTSIRGKREPNMLDTALEADGLKVVPTAESAVARASSTGALSSPDVSNPLIDIILAPSAPSPSIRDRHSDRQRAATAGEVFHKKSGSGKPTTAHALRRQPSMKQRFISRMINGLSNRAHSSQSIVPEANEPEESRDKKLTQTESCPNSWLYDNSSKGSRSSSSIVTDTCCGSDLDDVLAVFPSPPMSHVNTPLTPGSFESSSPDIKTYRNHRMPEKAAIMGVEMKLTPEYDQLRANKGKNMLVAIDIQRDMNAKGSGRNLWSQQTNLDVVLIIDNSLSSSPATLMASCETARFLASILDLTTDRMAILCTGSTDMYASKPKLILPLTNIKMSKIKTALDDIVSSSGKPDIHAVDTAIRLARELLSKSPVPESNREQPQDAFGHVILFSADANGLQPELLAHETLPLHVVYAGSVPLNRQESIICNGWKMHSKSENEPQAVSASKDMDPQSLSNALRALIMHARRGKSPGTVSDLVLDIKAGPGCSVDGVMGRCNYRRLHPGEIITVLVKLRIDAFTAHGYSLTHTLPKPQDFSDPRDLLTELDKMLGTSATSILTAELKYKHSSLPPETICTISAECQVKKQLPNLAWCRNPHQQDTARIQESTSMVQKRLAYYLAAKSQPRDAITIMCVQFGSTGSRSACPNYVKRIMKELEYQARLDDRYDINCSPSQSDIPPKTGLPPDRSGHISSEHTKIENNKPQDCTPNISSLQRASPKSASSEIGQDLWKELDIFSPTDLVDNGEARRIWGDMRKRSRATSDAGTFKAVSSELDEERKKMIKDIALRNKRSVGAETLKSLTGGAESMGKGVGAPWL